MSDPTPPPRPAPPHQPHGSASDLGAGSGTGSDKVEAATVEAVVRQQLSKALGGRRGMAEAAVPTILFTASWLTLRDLELALSISIGAALVLLAVRLVQRSTVQFVLNALFAIGIGYLFVRLAAASGGSESEQALAFFLPGILVSTGYTVVMAGSCLVGWPFVGFLLGSVTQRVLQDAPMPVLVVKGE